MKTRRWRDVWSKRRVRRARTRVMMELCDDCRHPWIEHLGAFADADDFGGCGECLYEIEHGEREPASICKTTVPPEVLDRAQASDETA